MKRGSSIQAIFALAAIFSLLTGCTPKGPEINFNYGEFPQEVVNLSGINSAYDDYNSNIPQLGGELPINFSSNRGSSGGQFDIVTGLIWFTFNMVDGSFAVNSEMISNIFFNSLQENMNSDTDQLGPYRFFNSKNGMEYFFVTDETTSDGLDIRFISYIPPSSYSQSIAATKRTASALCSSADDGYIAFEWGMDKLYINSNRNGDFDILETEIITGNEFEAWLTGTAITMAPTDSINSISDDKCPFIMSDVMVFTSDREGGFGGFDLYYSIFKGGKWSSPVNFGPEINTEYNEYRPLLGYSNNFTNEFMIFSSDRPGGSGGYDLYFAGVTIER